MAALCVLVALLTSCVTVPTTGPVRKVEGQQQTCQNCVDVEVAAPSPGDDPRRIVEGYLRATSHYQPNYSVAKQFLTKAAVEKCFADRPELGAELTAFVESLQSQIGSEMSAEVARTLGVTTETEASERLYWAPVCEHFLGD